MNILVGSHGTGKSTLVKLVQEKFPDYYCTDGFSRPVKRACGKLELSEFQEQVLIGELTAWGWLSNLDRDKYLATRSIIDPIVYSCILGYRDEYSRLLKIWEDNLGKALKARYFYLPIEFPLEDDGVRFSDERFQAMFDETLIRFLCRYGIKYEVLTGSAEKRLEKISFFLAK